MPTIFNHLVIPDTQCKPGVRLDYLRWAGQYAVDHFISKQRPVRLIHLGDHHDMPSLSSYDKGKGKMEGRRVNKDIEVGNEGFATLDEPISDYLRANKRTAAPVDKHFLFGNHEDRITRAINQDVQMDGLLGLHLLDHLDWQEHEFLKVVDLDGVLYSHYFENGMGKAMSGENLKLRLKNIGRSFGQGHKQGFDWCTRFLPDGTQQCGLSAGSYYVHDEDYMGLQGNAAHWRGLVVCHQVQKGAYNIMQVDLDYLCRKYEGVSLNRYKVRHYS